MRVLLHYFLLSYAATLINTASLLREVDYIGTLTAPFVIAAYLTYSFLYLLPVFIALTLLDRLLRWRPADRLVRRIGLTRMWILCPAAVLGTGLLQVALLADGIIFRLYGFHINGFVLNLVMTPGGIDSLEGGRSTTVSFALIIAGLFLAQAALLAVLLALPRLRRFLAAAFTRRRCWILAACLILASGFERITNGVANLQGYRPVLRAASAFPFYLPTTFNRLAERLGFTVVRRADFRLDAESLHPVYPQAPIRRTPVEKPLNIVWLVAESLRSDMVDPDIMPKTHAFSRKACLFRNHYSGGNGTRAGIFSMFYGLYGCYWFTFLENRQGPVIIDVLQDAGYQMRMFTSQSFTYPEFDKTVFVNMDKASLQTAHAVLPWRRDQDNVGDMINFIERRDPTKPFMTYMFFESTHAKYFFPADSIIREPYVKDLNYATMDVKADRVPIKNRYCNAAHYVDSQFGRVLDYLDQHGLLQSTVVLLTGDHGEEFMEKGRWGHNSAFSEEQTRAPLVLWVPGQPPREITRLTSHLDIPATLMPLLGVQNPAGDYSLGYDLLGSQRRTYTIVCDWNSVAYIDDEYKAVLPLKTTGFINRDTTTKDDVPLADSDVFYQSRNKELIQLMREIKRFGR